MTNKKMIETLKNNRKTLAAIMVATAMMGITSTVYAAENDDQPAIEAEQSVNNDTNSIAGNDSSSVSASAEDSSLAVNTGDSAPDISVFSDNNNAGDNGDDISVIGRSEDGEISAIESNDDAADETEAEAATDVNAIADAEADSESIADAADHSIVENIEEIEDSAPESAVDGEDENAEKTNVSKDAVAAVDPATAKALETLQKNISSAGAVLYNGLKNMSSKSYENTAQIKEDVEKLTLRVLTETVLKDLPYFGGFLNAASNDYTGNKSETQQILAKMTEMNQNILAVMDAININGQNISATIKETEEHAIIRSFDAFANELISTFNSCNGFFTSAYETVGKITDETEDEVDYAALYKNFEVIYNTKMSETGKRENLEYYNSYMNFLEAVQNCGITNTGKNIFVLTDSVYLGDGVDIAKNEQQRTALADRIENMANYGYWVLGKSMDLELQRLERIQLVCNAQIASLQEQKKTADDETKEKINALIRELNSELVFCQGKMLTVTNEKAAMIQKLTAVANLISQQRESISAAKAAFLAKNASPAKEITINGQSYGCIEINGEVLYPSFNGDNAQIEYKDIYGNILATRAFSVSESTDNGVNKYQIQKGSIYYVTGIYGGFFSSFQKYKCQILDVYEASTLFGTNRTIKAVYLEGPNKGQEFTQVVKNCTEEDPAFSSRCAVYCLNDSNEIIAANGTKYNPADVAYTEPVIVINAEEISDILDGAKIFLTESADADDSAVLNVWEIA